MRKREEPRKINQTFSLPLDISKDLHTYVKRREMSQFVSNALRKELAFKKEELRQAYMSASEDEDQRNVMSEWESTIGDGSNEW